MRSIRFDVNDSQLRDLFVRRLLHDAIDGLADTSQSRWGKMTAQQMVEHLTWAFELSTGKAGVGCGVPEPQREQMKAFLHSNRPSPREFMNPALVGGLPALRCDGLEEAKAALRVAAARFLESSHTAPHAIHTHPIFGPIGVEEWSRTHFKHCYHHLLQFGLLIEAV
jgi:oxepin-CoA hydrolase / 3-oxo-5,6-dehydrosuberyl-CoA semialdehyde dehydrogenase